MIEIRKEYLEEILEYYKRNKDKLLRSGKLSDGKLRIFKTEDGEQIITAKAFIKRKWYAIICIHDDLRTDVIDCHVFKRYLERFLCKRASELEVISEFIYRGNCSGTMVIEDNNIFTKRVRDGLCIGESFENDTIFYHRTFLTENMAVGYQKTVLNINTYVND